MRVVSAAVAVERKAKTATAVAAVSGRRGRDPTVELVRLRLRWCAASAVWAVVV